jgi:rod shape determining protein RodA
MNLRDRGCALGGGELTLPEKLLRIRWFFVLAICAAAGVGIVMLYSAAGGTAERWAIRQAARFGVALGIMPTVAVSGIGLWLRWAYPFYFVALSLLLIVDLVGTIGMGAQRWIDLGIINLQPSEVMKIALVLALARYFHGLATEDVGRPAKLVVPAVMVLTPVALVLKQPDLGTAMILLLGGAAVFFAAGVRIWMFAVVFATGLAALPVAWGLLHEYQRRRVLTFFEPEGDPAITSCNRRSRWARAACSAGDCCKARRATSISCRRSRRTSSSRCWPRNSG